jgi:alkylation response protein AidB-like acyl-CoA dehydrogenase
MDFGFTDEQEVLKKSAREVLAAKAPTSVARKALEKSKTGTDEALWSTIAELGWAGVAIDETLGGLGLGLIELAIIAEELGRAVAPAPFVTTVGIAAQIVAQADQSATRDAFLRAVAAGERRAAFAGSISPRDVTVKASKTDAGAWKFSGTAALVPEAHVADDIVVVARIARAKDPRDGLGLFVVPVSALRSKPKPQPSLDAGRRLADVKLGGAEVPADALIAENAWPVLERGLDRAAVVLAAEAVGVASAVLERAVEYARERKQFDRPIGTFQAISHKCADMLLWTETARSHTYYAAWALEEGATDAHLAAATAKAAAADAARIAANDSIQVHGGIGFTWEHDLHLYFRRAKFDELYLGDATFWRERIASVLAS